MTKHLIKLAVILMLAIYIGSCASKTEETIQETTKPAETPQQDTITSVEESPSDLPVEDITEIDTIDNELDDSEVDSITGELADLDW
tara:strand:+ start:314 stop:574 length:261 start_codon:yes stop_codon:yes gene_type:complete